MGVSGPRRWRDELGRARRGRALQRVDGEGHGAGVADTRCARRNGVVHLGQLSLLPRFHLCRRPAELVHCKSALESGVPALRRFTGGGTVVVDADTVFATLIMEVRRPPTPLAGWGSPTMPLAPCDSINWQVRQRMAPTTIHYAGAACVCRARLCLTWSASPSPS